MDDNEKNDKKKYSETIRKRKAGRYYLYYEFYRPVELVFFGAFLGIFLGLLYNEILGLGIEIGKSDPYFWGKIFITLWLTGWCLFTLGLFVAAWDYSQPRSRIILLYIGAPVIYLCFGSFFLWIAGTEFISLFPVSLKWKATAVLPITYCFWAVWREVMMRVVSSGVHEIKK